jgi:hypothetical protein
MKDQFNDIMRTERIIPGILGACLIGMIIICGCTNLQINSDPTGADVIINGEKVGQTDYEAQVNPGTYSIVLTKSGYENFKTQETVREDETTVIHARLVRLTNEMKLVYEKTITVRKNCYAYYRYLLAPGTQVTAEVIASGDMYGFTTIPNEFDNYLRIVNGGAQSASGMYQLNEHQWGTKFKVTNFVPEGYPRGTYYFVIDNTPISHYLTYSQTLPSAGGSVLVRITTNDPTFTIVAESEGCMPGGTQ